EEFSLAARKAIDKLVDGMRHEPPSQAGATDTALKAEMRLLQGQIALVTERRKLFNCTPGWTTGGDDYVVAVPDWAAQAGLRPGDQLASIGGRRIDPATPWANALGFGTPKGGPVTLTVTRGTEEVSLTLPCESDVSIRAAEER